MTGKGRRRGAGPEEPGEFRDAVSDARPLEGRDRERPPPSPRPRRAAARAEEPAVFEVERRGEEILGRAPGIDRANLRRLRADRAPVELRTDLHGLTSGEARRQLRDAFERARDTGARHWLVVHGRGHHSEDGPVLKEALIGWLAESPIGERVLAFASAAPRLGGPGATLVLLRRWD